VAYVGSYAGISDETTWNFTTADADAPTVPTNLSLNVISTSQIDLSWDASTDNVGVTGYRIYRDDVEVGSGATTTFSDTGLSAFTSYTYRVSAFDAAGNESAQSDPEEATTEQTTVNLSSCGYLDQAGMRYEVQQNLSSTGTCLILIADDITVDLNGHTITYDDDDPITIDNGDFEVVDSGDPTHADGWDFTNAPDAERAAGTLVQPVTVGSGSYAIRIPSTAADQYLTTSGTVTLDPNTTYSLSARFRNKESNDLDMYVRLAGTGVIAEEVGFSSDGFSWTSTTFTTGDTPEEYQVQVGMSGALLPSGGYVYIDSVTIQRYRSYGIATGPASLVAEEFPGVTRYGSALRATILSGSIVQGLGGSDYGHGIYARDDNLEVADVDITVHGVNANNFRGYYVDNFVLRGSTLRNNSTIVADRHDLDGAAVKMVGSTAGSSIHDNTIIGSPQSGMVINGGESSNSIYNNTISVRTRYTNGFGIQIRVDSGSLVYNNIIGGSKGTQVYDNTISVRDLPRNGEYNGCVLNGAYGIQLESLDGDAGIDIYNNTVTAVADECAAAAFRPVGEDDLENIEVYGNTFIANRLATAEDDAHAAALRPLRASGTGQYILTNNIFRTNSQWILGQGMQEWDISGNTFETSGTLDDPFLPLATGNPNDPANAIVGMRFIDNSYPDSTTHDLFTTSSFQSYHNGYTGGGVDDTSSSFHHAFTLTGTVLDGGGSPVVAASVSIEDTFGSGAFTGTTDAQGEFVAVLNEFTNTGGTVIQFNPYLVTATFGGETATGSVTLTGATTLELTMGADEAAPTVSTLTPADNATDIAVDANLVITFDETIGTTGTGYVTIYDASDDSIVEQINTATGAVTGSGTDTITVNPASDLDPDTSYYIHIDANAFPDAAGNFFAGISDETTWNFTTVDATVPTISSITPPANGAYVAGQNLDFTVNTTESVIVNTGGGTPRLALTIGATARYASYLSGSSTDSLVFRYTVQAGDTDTDGIALASPLETNGGTIKDAIGNDLTATFTSPDLTNVLVDTTAPTVSTLSPVDDATDVAVGANLVITFDEAVDAESGNITIKRTSDDSTIEAIDVTSGQVTGGGTDTITINPAANLDQGTEYYIQVDATAFDDAAGNSFAGISSTTEWSVTTADVAPTIEALSPTDGATDVATTANLVITFDETIGATGTGTVTIKKSSDDSTVEVIAVTGSLVTGSGTDTITVNPTSDLDNSTAYYIQIDANAFPDATGNFFAGISDETTWNFTTAAAPSSPSPSPVDTTVQTSGGGGGGGGGRRGITRGAASTTTTARVEESGESDVRHAAAPELLPNVRGGFLAPTMFGRQVYFSDVKITDWFAPHVFHLIEREIASGYRAADGTVLGVYGPGDPVTYAEIAKMAIEASGKSDGTTSTPHNRFAVGHWSQHYIAIAEQENFSVFNGSFNIDQPATRGEVVRTLLEAFDIPLDDVPANELLAEYRDLRPSHPHARAIGTATRMRIVQGDTDRNGVPSGTVRPNDPVNRAEVAKMVSLLLQTTEK